MEVSPVTDIQIIRLYWDRDERASTRQTLSMAVSSTTWLIRSFRILRMPRSVSTIPT